MRFGVLGPLEVLGDDGDPVDIGGRQARVVLAALVAADGRPVGADTLIETVWPTRPPATAAGTLQSYVSRLRRALAGIDLVFDDAGYRLDLTTHTVDVHRFEELCATGRDEMAAGRPVAARRALSEALALWRGPALVDLVEQGASLALAATLDEQRMAALEARIDADLALGRHTHVVGELQLVASENPLREGVHARLAVPCTAAAARPRRFAPSRTRAGTSGTSSDSNRDQRCASSNGASSTRIRHSTRRR